MIRFFKKLGKGVWRGLKFAGKAARHPIVRFGLTFVGPPAIVNAVINAVSLVDSQNMTNVEKHAAVQVSVEPLAKKYGLSESQLEMLIKGIVAQLRGEAVIEVDND